MFASSVLLSLCWFCRMESWLHVVPDRQGRGYPVSQKMLAGISSGSQSCCKVIFLLCICHLFVAKYNFGSPLRVLVLWVWAVLQGFLIHTRAPWGSGPSAPSHIVWRRTINLNLFFIWWVPCKCGGVSPVHKSSSRDQASVWKGQQNTCSSFPTLDRHHTHSYNWPANCF